MDSRPEHDGEPEGEGEQTTMDKDCSETEISENKDSAYGTSTSITQQRSTQSGSTGPDSSSLGGSSLANSHPSSGSETSSMCTHRKGRAAAMAVDGQSASGALSGSRIDKPTASHATASSTDDADSKGSSESKTSSEEGVLQKEAYQNVMSYIRKIVEWEKDSKRTGEQQTSQQAQPDDTEHSASATPTCLEVLVSLRKGTVVETSASTRDLLGYPSDMWVGRSFIDYVYPKDRASFTRFISSMGVDTDGLKSGKGEDSCSGELYCRLRHYRGLKSVGFNVVSRAHIYKPFQMRLVFRDKELNGESPCILVVAEVLQSAYKLTPDGVDLSFRDVMFTMRHSAACRVDQFDNQGISLLGHLPQDVVGHSIVDFFHPEDLPTIKDVYRKVTQRVGMPFRSRPYRLRTHNGCYVSMETDWSCFINPWSNHIEAVICLHRVLEPPENINVFEEDEDRNSDSVEMMMLSNSHRIDIENILSKSISATEPQVNSTSQRRKRLVMLMEHLITELETVERTPTPEYDHTSVPGDVSPHTSERGSPAPVSVTPPNYLQLNYKETMERFFQSQPKTMHGSSDESDAHGSVPADGAAPRQPVLSLGRQPGGSGTHHHHHHHHHHKTSARDTPNPFSPQASYQHRPLTQEVLDRHNADMEKNMRQSLGTKKAHDAKGKFGKRKDKSGPDQNKEPDELDSVRRRVMNNTPAWPEPSVFWPPFSVCQSGNAAPPQVGYGYWVVDQAPFTGRLVQPGVLVQPVPNALLTAAGAGQLPSEAGPSAAGRPLVYMAPLPLPTAPVPPAQQMPRHQDNATGSKQGQSRSTLSLKRPRIQTVKQQTAKELRKFLDSDEDVLSKEKQYHSDLSGVESRVGLKSKSSGGEQVSISHQSNTNSMSSFHKDLDNSGDSNCASWLDGSDCPKTDIDIADINLPLSTKPRRPVLKDPPWLENVTMDDQLAFQYQLDSRNLEEVLERDRQALMRMSQPALLTEQLEQLYRDLEAGGGPASINLDEREPSSSSSSDESAAVLGKRLKRSRRVREYDRLTIVHEEDAPLPPPDLLNTFQPHLVQVPTSV